MPDIKPLIVTIPHSGERVPHEVSWLLGLPEVVLMCDVDRFVDRLYEPALTKFKIPHVKTEWNRYVVDLNRLPNDIDGTTVEGSGAPSGKFMTGLHWTKTTRGSPLMSKPMSRALHEQLVAHYFEPFHSEVKQLYQQLRSHKKIYHLDAHSMPSVGTAGHKDPGQRRSDIVISDGEGKCCEPWYRDLVVQAYEQAGLKVSLNWPYGGGQVTQTYGHPDKGQHAIQVEINRALYMNEETKQWIPDRAADLQARLINAVQWIYERLP